MSEQEIRARLHSILVDQFEVNETDLTPDVTLYDQLGLDSLDSVDLVVAMEKEFGFKIVRSTDEEKISAMRKLGDIYEFIHTKLENN
jgi:acyl carrier protein